MDDLAAGLNQQAQQNARPGFFAPSRFTSDAASLQIQASNGSFVIDQRLATSVLCEFATPDLWRAVIARRR
jgi:hypothetical protein